MGRSELPVVGVGVLLFLVPLLGLALGGCGGSPQTPLPKTYPVTGKVLCRGGQPFPGGVIQFLAKSEPTLTITGEIQEDGTFMVSTLFQGKKLPGAVAGACQVLISPRITENKPVAIYQPQHVYTVQAKPNIFVIEIESPPNER